MSHENVMSSMLGYTTVAEILDSDVYMAYLPLAHVLEFIGGKVKRFILNCLNMVYSQRACA